MMARAVVMLSVVLTAYSLWAAANPMMNRVFGDGTVSEVGLGSQQNVADIATVDLGPVLDFAPFGLAEGQNIAATPDGMQSDYVLLGITTARNKNDSRAIISGGDVPVTNYAIGAGVAADVVLSAIFADHVVLSVAGQDQALYFLRDGGVDPATLLVASTKAEPIQKTPDDETLLGRYRAEIQQDALGLLQRLGLEVTDQGYRVTDAASEVILRAGLRPGDLINAVNGKPLGDLDSDPALFDEVAAVGVANFEVMRDGQAMLMTFPLK